MEIRCTGPDRISKGRIEHERLEARGASPYRESAALREGFRPPGRWPRGRGFEVTCLFHRDQFHEAKDLIEELLPLTMKKESPEAMLFLKVFYASVWRMLGELELAKRYGSEVIKLASGLGMTWWRREALLGSALTLELDGDLESAIQRISGDRRCQGVRDHVYEHPG